MNGARSLLSGLVGAGVDVCFMNPGTSEMHFVQALDAVPDMRGVLALFEGVATGAADGYARITGRPAAVLLHLGPGLANGTANLHNARRAHSPVLCVVGAHATDHVRHDAPLQSDIDAIARGASGWVHTSGTTRALASDAMRAVEATGRGGGQVATLVLPADVSWSDGGRVAPPRPFPVPSPVSIEALDSVAASVGEGTVLLLGGDALSERGLRAASRISRATGTRLVAERFAARMESGAGVPTVDRLAYLAEQVRPQLAGATTLVLAGAPSPVAFFAYPGVESDLVPDGCAVLELADAAQDVVGALEALAGRLASDVDPDLAPLSPVDPEPGPLSVRSLGAAIAVTLPENAIVVDESITSGGGLKALTTAPRHSLLTLTGGAIGQGLPVATGAAVAAPDRPVVTVEADGSALYTIQALWTQAREQLDVTTVVVNNAAYAILRGELARTGAGGADERAQRMLDLTDPTTDFTAVSRGLGVPAERATTSEELVAALRKAHAEPGPHLIEAIVPPVA
ncbi:acetolactate synthase large subunit [Pseudonocardia endophytica]|uniref:Acetolactate synthase-1/2/3 large subunit n=1 Tax=Pseudonocardia endophytica TaxID=401976 RepID=A0A4R1IAV5_PSEEN|nr:acetolactate synthase large subunit [Pseudonocardia endophytica]TCK27512.1 acetolactate synthase-1/2/3 large subunit [Pseudonocardia endophytica]